MELERETMNRLFLIRKLKQLNVEVSDKAVADQITEYPFLKDRTNGQFDKQIYDRFLKTTLAQAGYTAADFHEYAAHDAGIEHLIPLAGLTGDLVTPREAETSFRQEREQVSAHVMVFPASNHISQVQLDPLALAQFYTNRQAAYRVPERMVVSYVKFEMTNSFPLADQELEKMTNLAQIVDRFYLSRGTNSFTDDTGKPLAPEAAKEKIKQQFREELALRDARKKANEFAHELFEQSNQGDFLEKLAAAKGYLSRTTEPFAEYSPPVDLKVPSNFGQTAFKLTPEVPFGGPITGEDGVYIIAFKSRIPSTIPPMDSVRTQLTEDYINFQSRELAPQAATNFFNTLTNKLAQGQSFQAIGSEEKVTPIKLSPFSRSTQSVPELEGRLGLPEVKNAAFTVPPGQNAAFAASREGAFVLHVDGKLPVPETELKHDLPDYLAELRERRRYAAFSDWFRKEMEQARVIPPGGRKPSE
jgi:hypothetical protein